MATDQTVTKDFDTMYNESYYVWNTFYPEAETDLRYYLGDQWSEREKQTLFQEGRSAFVFNYVRRIINMITGYQRKNRLSSVVSPIENSDQKTADQLSQLLLYVMNYGEGYRTISDCFGGALKTGWNLCSVWMDYRDDPLDGDIRFGREPYNSFICDPYFSNLDWSDCNYILRRKYLSLEQAQSMLPKHRKELEVLHKIGWERDDKFTWLPYQRQPNGRDLLAYNEMWQQKWKMVPFIVDMETAEYMEWDGPKDRIGAFLDMHENLKVIDRPKKYVEQHIIINGQLIRTEVNPYGLNEYPYVPFTAIFEPETDQWDLKIQSLTRCIRDPQKEANKRRSQMVDMLDSQINSGWIAEEDSVINPRSLFQSGQGKVIWKKKDAGPGALEKQQPAQIPPSMFQLQDLFNRDMVEIAGVNDASFGIAESANESGVLMMLRQGSSLVNLQDLFDNLRMSQKAISQKVLRLIQQWSPKKIERIINEKPTEQFYNKEFTKYDVVVQEGILTDTQRQMYFRQLLDLKAAGAPVTGEMLAEAAPIQGKSKYTEQLAAIEKAQAESAQKQQQLQNQLLQSQQQLAQAKAISDIALGKERFTRSVANMGLEDERAAAAVADRSKSALDRVKAVKELQAMDDDKLMKYFTIIKMMEQSNRKQEQQIKADDVTISAQVSQPGSENPVGQPQQQQNQTMGVPDEERQL
jgi:hypothetical protein